MGQDWAIAHVFPLILPMIDSHSEDAALGNLDSRAITAVYNRYFPEVFRYVRFRLDDDLLAEDISSEVFCSLLKAIKAGRTPNKNLRGWLIGSARHMIIDHFRREHRHPSESISDALPANGLGPSEEVESRLASKDVNRALIQLSEEQQQVLALRFGQGYSLEETAALMKKRITAVKALQFRALKALQHRFGDGK
jgi:RNA polymerase sigma-70 factor (ECF subfamily)